MPSPLLRIRSYDKIVLDLRQAEIAALMGPPGSGKSQILRSILGLASMEGLSIDWEGTAFDSLLPEKRALQGIGYSPEERGIFPSLHACDNLLAASRYNNTKQARQSMDATLEYFPSLKPHLNRPAWQLSGGQQRLLSIARALMRAERLLILDSPFLGLSLTAVTDLRTCFQTLTREHKLAILLAEDRQELVSSLAHRIIATPL